MTNNPVNTRQPRLLLNSHKSNNHSANYSKLPINNCFDDGSTMIKKNKVWLILIVPLKQENNVGNEEKERLKHFHWSHTLSPH